MKKSERTLTTKLIDAAFLAAAHDVVERAKQTRTPVLVWEGGKMKKLDPHKIRLPRSPKKRRPRG